MVAILVLVLVPALAPAAEETSSWPTWWPKLLGAQATVIFQDLLPFHSPYSGQHSLRGTGDGGLTHTYGVYLGSQVLRDLQAYIDVEMARGSGVNKAVGLAGYVNGDVIRQGSADLGEDPFIARAFLRYVIPLGAETEVVEADIDHLPGRQPQRRMEIKVGRMAASDDFDLNRYANNTRTQFMNWSLFNNAAWDFAADTRGFTNGITAAFVTPRWSVRLGSYQMSTQANGNILDNDVLRARGDNLEVTVKPNEAGTTIRVLAYENHARMGIYRHAIATARTTGEVPSVAADDRPGRVKYGFGVNVEQPLADGGNTGLFVRGGWNDGRTEAFEFTEVDRHLSLGLQVSGARWGRPEDQLGAAYVLNWLSSEHRAYLAAGGVGFLLGDGKLNYGAERILELNYRWQIVKFAQFSPDFQYVENPGYNRDRGPAFVLGARLRVYY